MGQGTRSMDQQVGLGVGNKRWGGGGEGENKARKGL